MAPPHPLGRDRIFLLFLIIFLEWFFSCNFLRWVWALQGGLEDPILEPGVPASREPTSNKRPGVLGRVQ